MEDTQNREVVRHLPHETREYKTFSLKGFFLAIFVGFLLVSAFLISANLYISNMVQLLLLALISLVGYSILLFFLLEPEYIREVRQTVLRTVEKPVYREVYFEKPVVKEVFIEKPVIKEVIRTVNVPEYREVTKPIYIEAPRRSLSIPKYLYVGSKQTKRFHTRLCRLAKLIKKKYKISNNSKKYFINHKFKSCKVCILKSKKI